MNNNYLQLTEMDKTILDSYSLFVSRLSSYLGDGYEVILHSLENLNSSAIQVFNGHYSGREVGSPITDLALYMLDDFKNNSIDRDIKYFNKSKSGATLRSCTIPIEG